MIAAGAAGADTGKIVYRESLMGKMVSAYQFG